MPNDNLLLNYRFSTTPSPLQTSTPQNPVTGRLNVAALPIAPSVYASEIVIRVPVGIDSASVYSAAPSSGTSTGKWVISSMVPESKAAAYATFTFDCAGSTDYLIDYDLVFGFLGTVTPAAGQFTIRITETSGTTSDPSTFTVKTGSFVLSTTTPMLFLENFAATAVNTPTVPATEFRNGDPIRFSWESNGTFFQLYRKNETTPIYSGTDTTFTLAAGVITDTTFFLVASSTGNLGSDQSSGSYEPIFLYDALGITITNPTLTPLSVTTSGPVAVGADLSVTNNTTLAGTLGVSGKTSLSDLNVSGMSNLASAILGGTLTVNAASTLAGATVNDGLNVTGATTLLGGLTATSGPFSAIGVAQRVSPGSYVAGTDGIVVGTVGGQTDGQYCLGTALGTNGDGMWLYATGMTMNSFLDQKNIRTLNSFTMPVRKGATWQVIAQQDPNNVSSAMFFFYWIPLGTASAAITFEEISDKAPAFPAAAASPRAVPKESNELDVNLDRILAEMIGRPVEPDLTERFIAALTSRLVGQYTEQSKGTP